MNTKEILEALDAEISRLRQVRDLLSDQDTELAAQQTPQAQRNDLGDAVPRKRGRPFPSDLPETRIGDLAPKQIDYLA